MTLLGTHNSLTGEKSGGLLSRLVAPFSRCQRRTIAAQWVAGVRLFDFRVRRRWTETLYGYYGLRFFPAHGFWHCNTRVESFLEMLDKLAAETQEQVFVMLTYEGHPSEREREAFLAWAERAVTTFQCVTFTNVAVKRPKWEVLRTYNAMPRHALDYANLGKPSWRWLLPIPRFWARFTKHAADAGEYSIRDFI